MMQVIQRNLFMSLDQFRERARILITKREIMPII
eukprot:CCRYP_020292-RB/>CCRYP_020292-RB protein AED:0.38 eAED:1.00 QI:0/-1/0/1/-1/0/1/0/33